MAELDLTHFLKDASVADLDWLDVDEEEYRAQDRLPKQNLDIQPDLEALWAREGESPTTYLVPNVVPVPTPGINNPHTMGDMSQEHGRLRAQAEEIRKVARLALMQTSEPTRLRTELVKRFGMESLREHRTVLAEVLEERGLLGKLYIDAADFPTCATSGKQAEFVRRYASDAKYVLAKTACGGCCHASKTPTGGTTCGVFHKEVKVEIPYSENLAEAVEQSQESLGKVVQASELAPKERIRLAFLAPNRPKFSETYQGHGVRPRAAAVSSAEANEKLVEASSLLKKKRADEQLAMDAKPVIAFLHKEMVKGLSHAEVAQSLKIAFDAKVLTRTHTHWGPLFKEAGLYGIVYTKQASFDDCHKGADFLAKHNPSVRAIVAGEKCGSCIYNKTRCLLYGKPLVKNASEVLTNETVESVLWEHKTAGRLPSWDTRVASEWGGSPSQALKAIHEATQNTPVVSTQGRMGMMTGFYGQRAAHVASGSARREIVKQASKLMNEGLYGEDLATLLKARFEARDLVAAKEDLRVVLAEQGLQGIYYVDPSVYEDYGRGCDEASRLHRSRLVPYAKQGSKCDSCVLQQKKGFCSKLNKELVVEPPYANKQAQQREVLASGRSTEISPSSLMNNGASMIAEYQMQNGGMDIELHEASTFDSVAVELGTGKVKL